VLADTVLRSAAATTRRRARRSVDRTFPALTTKEPIMKLASAFALPLPLFARIRARASTPRSETAVAPPGPMRDADGRPDDAFGDDALRNLMRQAVILRLMMR
jgi:hypothetical protein